MTFQTLIDFLKATFTFDEHSPLLFTQFYFWVFFAFVMVFFSLFHRKRLLRNTFLFAVSLFFYYKTSGLFVLILLFSTVSDFIIGKCIYNSKQQGWRRFFAFLSVFTNLAVLCYFKYAYFFTDLHNTLLHSNSHVINYLAVWSNGFAGTHFAVDKILLPVGVSFFTFQIISYTVDVYKGRIKPVKNILDFGFYVTFFPQLVAGPIVRASEFVPQIYKPFFLTRKQFGIAVFFILNGLVKKIVLSDYLAVNFIDRVFDNPLIFTGFENLMALFGYSLQVYADFSGYTDIAIGVAMIMGFYLPKNFDSPYKATNPSNFWKRWHISLSRWLQNYLYIPLGGNRRAGFLSYFLIALIAGIAIALSQNIYVAISIGIIALGLGIAAGLSPKFKKNFVQNLNMMITMLMGGLWHGASWNFMIWGGLNGSGILVYRIWKSMSIYVKTLFTLLIFALFFTLNHIFPKPIFMILAVWTGVIFGGTLLDCLYRLIASKPLPKVNRVWSILVTFVFITFTRLFFRSGSNLDPAQANEAAWDTAQNMVKRIGGAWKLDVIPQVIYEYRAVFGLFVLGMIIHWLPKRWKRWYTLNFALLPMLAQIAIVVAVIFTSYQFITADLKAFIYFQF